MSSHEPHVHMSTECSGFFGFGFGFIFLFLFVLLFVFVLLVILLVVSGLVLGLGLWFAAWEGLRLADSEWRGVGKRRRSASLFLYSVLFGKSVEMCTVPVQDMCTHCACCTVQVCAWWSARASAQAQAQIHSTDDIDDGTVQYSTYVRATLPAVPHRARTYGTYLRPFPFPALLLFWVWYPIASMRRNTARPRQDRQTGRNKPVGWVPPSKDA